MSRGGQMMRSGWILPPVILLLLLLFPACEATRSDAVNASRAAERARRQNLRELRQASAAIPRGTPVSGAALVAALEGRTHIFVFGRRSKVAQANFTESFHFVPGGEMAYTNNEWAPSPNRAADRWRVEGERLCILINGYSHVEKCYTIASDGAGRIQYFIADPGDESDGLLTRVTDEIRDGPPPGP